MLAGAATASGGMIVASAAIIGRITTAADTLARVLGLNRVGTVSLLYR